VSAKSSALAHQFDDMRQQREAAELGMWAFLLTELMLFGGFFTGYTVYRSSYPEAFVLGSRQLDVLLGGVNTAVLILSSLTMALAVHCAQVGKRRWLVANLGLTMLFGTAFLGIKAVEYSHKFHEHLVPGPSFHLEGASGPEVQLFFGFYFGMTGTHALHMVIGIGLLAFLMYRAVQGRYSPEYYAPVEMVGLYWHFVDIVWIFLYPLLYLLGRH
jgi:cytochrome c oxidase subunit 3